MNSISIEKADEISRSYAEAGEKVKQMVRDNEPKKNRDTFEETVKKAARDFDIDLETGMVEPMMSNHFLSENSQSKPKAEKR